MRIKVVSDALGQFAFTSRVPTAAATNVQTFATIDAPNYSPRNDAINACLNAGKKVSITRAGTNGQTVTCCPPQKGGLCTSQTFSSNGQRL